MCSVSGSHAVLHGVEPLAGEGHLRAVGQVPAVRQRHREEGVAGLQERAVGGQVGVGARVRLQVGVLGAEELLGARDADLLGPVDDLAAAVVAPSGIALGVLVRQRAAQRGEHGGAGEVLAGDQLQAAAQAVQLVEDDAGDVGVEGGQGVEVRAPVGGAHRGCTPDERPRAGGAAVDPGSTAAPDARGHAVPTVSLRRPRGELAARPRAGGRRSIAPTRRTRGRRAGAVDDRAGRRAGPRAAVQDDGRVRAQLVDRLLRGRGGRAAGAVGAGDGERAGAPQQVAGDVVVGQPDGDRPLGVAEVPGQGRRVLEHQGEPAGPERLGQLVRHRRQVHDQPGQRRRLADQHRHGHRPAAVLGREQAGHRGRGERVGGDAVDGVGGQQHQLAPADRGRGGVEAGGACVGVGAVVEVGHGAAVSPTAGSAAAGGGEPGPAGEVGVVLDVGEAAVRADQRRQRARPAGRRARCRATRPGAAAARR